jgi:hypothetical protein
MTLMVEYLPHDTHPHLAAGLSGFLLLDATGPAQVFSSANDEARDAGLPEPYAIHLIARRRRSPPPPA